MSENNDTSSGTALIGGDATRIIRATAAMPYSGSIKALQHQRMYNQAIRESYQSVNVDDLVRWMTDLAEALGRRSATSNSAESELRELRAQRAAIREFLGVDQ